MVSELASHVLFLTVMVTLCVHRIMAGSSGCFLQGFPSEVNFIFVHPFWKVVSSLVVVLRVTESRDPEGCARLSGLMSFPGVTSPAGCH